MENLINHSETIVSRMAEEHRNEIYRTIEQIELEEQATKGDPFHPKLFTRIAHAAGHWLIDSGEKLVKRYETPVCRRHPSAHSYAQ